ncbi:MAG: M50 family metallopeptidase [Deltaproteobacteria bacterium]|nr:M50 family metallopeptidase [Deltaproteobacteria bacterium]
MPDTTAATRPESRRDLFLWGAVALSLAVALTPWGRLALYPFTLFTTWVHECGHALMATLLGGDVASVTIEPDTSGLTRSMTPDTLVVRGLVSTSGYLGASVFGCVLLVATRLERLARLIIWTLGVLMLLSLVFWVRNLFGAGVVLTWGAALIWLGRRGHGAVAQWVLSLLAVQVALNALYDIRILFSVSDGHSDALSMEKLFLLPYWFWAGGWMLASAVMVAATLWLTRTRPPR